MTTVNAGRILLGSLASVVEQRAPLFRALTLPLVLLVVVGLVQQPEQSAATMLLFGLVSLLLHTWFAITTHRIVLMGESAVPRWGLNRWTLRETRFTVFAVALFSGGLMLGLLVAIIPVIGPVLFVALAIVGVSCLSLVFPAIAVDDPISFTAAWEMAQGYIFTLIICVCVFPVVLSLPLLALSTLAGTGPVVALLQGMVTILTVTALSLAYSEIKRERGQHPS